MKKTLVLLSGIILFFNAHAQSFEIGARYFGISNWFFNSNVSNSGGTQNYSATYSYSYGLHLAYNFNEHTSIETNVLLAKLSQSYNGAFGSSGMLPEGLAYVANETYKSTTSLNVTQIPIFFRFLSGNGAYAEIGPEIDIVTDANYSATYSAGPLSSFNSDVASYYPSSYISGVLAFGNNIRLHNALFLNINLRFAYDFTDLKGVDSFGQNLDNDILYSGSSPYYSSRKPTHAVSAGFSVGIMYRFGHDF